MPPGRSQSLDIPPSQETRSEKVASAPTSPARKPPRTRAMSTQPASPSLLGRMRFPMRLLRAGFVNPESRDRPPSSPSSPSDSSSDFLGKISRRIRPSQETGRTAGIEANDVKSGEDAKTGAIAETGVPPADRDPSRSMSISMSMDTTLQSNLSQDTVGDAETEVSNELYGRLAEEEQQQHQPKLAAIAAVAGLPEGSEVAFRARIHIQRRVSAALTFVLLRDQMHSIQAVLATNAPRDMIKWVQRLPLESLVQITGTLRAPPHGRPIRSASCCTLEVAVHTIHLVNPAARVIPFNNYKPVPAELVRHRMAHRVLDLRHPSNQAIFRVRNMVTRKFRETLDSLDFIEIHTPRLQPAATESGAQVFKVNYFGRNAFLAQSPQLAKQMAISADFGRVYEVGPVFRAENSNTHRHLTEYTGLDIEMAITRSYHELIAVVDKFLRSIFAALQSMPELAVVRERFPGTDLTYPEQTPIIPYAEGIRMLRDDAADLDEEEDLSTRDEIRLGELVKARYHTDYFILDRFPASVRPFYARRVDGKWTNSFDVFLRGQEICTGGERIHRADALKKSMAANGLTGDGMEEYLSAFEIGAPRHGGAGLGLERIVMLFLELGDVRHATLFYRDPRSMPARPPHLPHPDADTMRERGPDTPLPALEDLIANYGDATNTSWLDDRFDIWRHHSGAAVGYARHARNARQSDKLVIVTGDPLCDERQYDEVICSFLHFVRNQLHMNPVWLLVSDTVQEILARRHDWRTLTCVEEQRVVAETHTMRLVKDHGRKHRRIGREGIRIAEVTHPDDDFKKRADVAIEEWKRSRKGKQVHLTQVRPWVDQRHRRYFAAEKDGALLALVVLAQLAPRHGWQVKWALDMPGSTNGAIEVLLEKALTSVSGPATFGAGASARLTPGMNLKGARAKFLAKTYHSLAETLGLGGKSEFREKFGALGEQVYICYPRHGVGIMDLRQIVKFFED